MNVVTAGPNPHQTHTLTSHSFTSILLVTLMRGWVMVSGPYGSLPHSLIIHIIDCCFFRKPFSGSQWAPDGPVGRRQK